MGNSPNISYSRPTLANFHNKYQTLESFIDPEKGKTNVFEKIKTRELVSCFKRNFSNEEIFYFFEREYKDRFLIVSPHVLNMKGFKMTKKIGCGNNIEVSLYEQFFRNSLYEQIKVKTYNGVHL